MPARKRASIKKEAGGGIVRAGLAAAGGAVAAGGWLNHENVELVGSLVTEADLQKLGGALLVIGAVLWSVLRKYLAAKAALK